MVHYKSLDVWREVMQLVKAVYALTKRYPKEEVYGLISQSRRAVISVSANIAEGFGRNYRKETIQFLHIARGSAYETDALLEAAVMSEILQPEEIKEVCLLTDKCIQLINGLIRYYENSNLK